MQVEIVYALAECQHHLKCEVPIGATAQEAIELSGLLKQCPDINFANNKIGIYGRVTSLDQVLNENDRIEIYRPLTIDPVDARRLRAKQ